MRLITTCTVALLLSVLVGAQDGVKQQSLAHALRDKFSAELSEQNASYREASKKLRAGKAYKQAQADGDRAKLTAH